MTDVSCFGAHREGAILRLRVQTRSSRKGPLGLRGEALKWGINAAPVDGKANEELIESISQFLDIPKRAISILKGETSRDKIVQIKGHDPEDLQRRLSESLSPR